MTDLLGSNFRATLYKWGRHERLIDPGKRSTSFRLGPYLVASARHSLGPRLSSALRRPSALVGNPGGRWRLCSGQPVQPNEELVAVAPSGIRVPPAGTFHIRYAGGLFWCVCCNKSHGELAMEDSVAADRGGSSFRGKCARERTSSLRYIAGEVCASAACSQPKRKILCLKCLWAVLRQLALCARSC